MDNAHYYQPPNLQTQDIIPSLLASAQVENPTEISGALDGHRDMPAGIQSQVWGMYVHYCIKHNSDDEDTIAVLLLLLTSSSSSLSPRCVEHCHEDQIMTAWS